MTDFLANLNIEVVLITLIIIIVIGGIIKGSIQGMKKNLFFLGLDVLFFALFYLTVNLIVPTLLNSDSIYGMFNLDPNYTNFYGYLSDLVANQIGLDPAALEDPAVMGTLFSIVTCLISVVYLLLLAIVYWIVVKNLVFYLFFKDMFVFNSKKLKYYEKKEQKYEKRHRGQTKKAYVKQIDKLQKKQKRFKYDKKLGILSGALRGAICSFLIMCVINSTIGIVPELNTKTNGESLSTESQASYLSIYDFILNQCQDNEAVVSTINYIKDYQRSNLIKTTNFKIGDKAIGDIFTDSIVSGKYKSDKDYTFAIREELSAIVYIAEQSFYLTNGFDFESVSWGSLNSTQVEMVESIFNTLADDQLVNNLAASLVVVAMSLDAVKDYLPNEIDKTEYKNIDWSHEFATVATLVKDLYDLGDLAHLRVLELDGNEVEDVFVDLGELKSINFIAHVGTYYALNTMNKNSENPIDVDSIERKLADMALNNKYTDDITSFKDLYAEFLELYNDVNLDEFKGDDGKITNYNQALTAIELTRYSTLVDTIIESNFISELLPDVIGLIRENLPNELGSILNPGVVTTAQWKNEIDTALYILNDCLTDENGVHHPFESFKKYDFTLLRNFSTETVMQSELLSYAVIASLIEASKGGGPLPDINEYICVPDYLAKDADENYRFDPKWYGTATEKGELEIMIDQIAAIASNIKNGSDVFASLSSMLAAISAENLVKSDVLYYSIDKTLQNWDELLVIPKSVTQTSEHTFDGKKREHVIKYDEMIELISIISNPDIFNLDALLSLDEDEKSDFDTNYSSIMSVLTSKTLYDKDTKDKTGLHKLFSSDILRATMSYFITEFGKDFVTLVDGSYKTDVNIDDNSKIKIINEDDFVNLIKGLNDLSIDITALTENPLNMLDSFKDENGELKESIEELFGFDPVSNTYNYKVENDYSSILHATLSNFMKEVDMIIIPDEVLLANKCIEGEELIDIISTFVRFDYGIFTDGSSEDDILNTMIPVLVLNERTYESSSIRATMTYLIDDFGLTIPKETLQDDIISVDVVNYSETQALLKAIEKIKKESGVNVTYTQAMEIEDLSLKVVNNSRNEMSSSIIIKATLTEVLASQKDIVIPDEAYNGDGKKDVYISTSETVAVLSSATVLFKEDTKLNNLSFNGFTTSELTEALATLNDSYIIKASLKKAISK